MNRVASHPQVLLRPFVRSGGPRALLVLALALAVATCRDALSPGTPIRGRVAIAPVMPARAELAAFGLVIDGVRFVVVRPAADTVADTTVALPPDATELALDLRVPLVTSPETLSVSIVALSGTTSLFTGTLRVRARTPSGVSDSVTATFVPSATQLIAIAGGGQTDTVGSPLTAPIEVEARAADGLGVGGVSVRFRPLVGGGAVADTVVVTDGAGRARTTVTLGSAAGAQSFEASAAGLGGSPVTFSAFGFAAGATRLVATAGDLQSAVVGTV